MKLRKQVLENGLEIVAECDPTAHSTAVGFFVNAGSRDEVAALGGVSHFLEHMAFKGTATRSAEDVNREFDEMGAHYNAFTSEEQTAYYASVLPEYQTAAVGLLADILRPSLREEDFDLEKQVIVEEIHMYEDQPPYGGDDRCKELYFGSHPLAQSVLGTVDTVTGLSAEQMREYHTQRYAPDNILLAAAGRVDFEQLRDQVTKITGSWKRIGKSRTHARAEGQETYEFLEQPQSTQQYVIQLTPGPSAEDPDRIPAKILSLILGDDTGSRIYWAMLDTGLAEQVAFSHHDYQCSGVYSTFMSCRPEATRDNLRRLQEIFREAGAEGITEEELELAKSKVESRLVLAHERPTHRMFNLATNWSQRREYQTVAEEMAEVQRVTMNEIHDVLEKYPLLRQTTVIVGPESPEDLADNAK